MPADWWQGATVTLECAFATEPAAAPTWTDITTHMQEFHFKTGREKILARIDHGQMTVRLRNHQRQFDPTHAGVYNSGANTLRPMKRMRLRATYSGTTYDLFSGFVNSWPQAWQGPYEGVSQVTVTDAFLPLAKVDVGEGATWPEEFSGARIGRVLDVAGWPAADRAIDTGYTEMPEETLALGAGVTALDYIKSVADSELGAFFCDGAGRAVFHDRHHRKASGYLTTAGTFGDANTAGIPYQDIGLDTDADRIYNDIQCTSSGHTHQTEDATSQTRYMRRTMARSISAAREAECEDQAVYLLSVYKDPQYQLDKIRVTPTTAAGWAQALNRKFADHVTVKRWPQQVGSIISQECYIEAVEMRGAPQFFDTAWTLSTPAFTAVDWWLLEDATYGVLDTTTKVVY